MKITLMPLFSKQNADLDHCSLGCEGQCKIKKVSTLGDNTDVSCPLSVHQEKTYQQICDRTPQPKVIFNTSATGDGKSLGAYLPGLIDQKYRIVGLYPTIELVKDQEKQITKYHQLFNLDSSKRVDSIYGAELARRMEQAKFEGKRATKFNELRQIIGKKKIILTNPDIFHLITHLRYQDITTAQDCLLSVLTQTPDLYLADEFHIFGEHQETAILNSMLLIKHSREIRRPLRFLFTSATPKNDFIKQLQNSGFEVATVEGEYLSKDIKDAPSGYRQICQKINLEFIELKQDQDSLQWLMSQIDLITKILKQETQRQGRGLIILNSMARVRKVVNALTEKLSPDIQVREISGIVDDQERAETRKKLESLNKPVLIVGTSAVDVGVDFEINLLIFENNNLATFKQRLGRLGRHPGFNNYQAFVLIPGWMQWIWQEIKTKLIENQIIDRQEFNSEIAPLIFPDSPSYKEYRHYWGGVQTQGMLISLSGATISGKTRGNERKELKAKTEIVRESIKEDGLRIYGDRFEKKEKHWYKLDQSVRDELLRFRGGASLQVAVWDEEKSRFYTYDLLRILPHVEIEVISKKDFFINLQKANRSALEFDEKYLHLYLKIKKWNENNQPFEIGLECDCLTRELTLLQPTEIEGLLIKNHPQKSQINECLENLNILTFLISIDRRDPKSHWTIKNTLRLPPTFGIYRLTDAQYKDYATAFNQDVLLLEALKWKIPRCENAEAYIY